MTTHSRATTAAFVLCCVAVSAPLIRAARADDRQDLSAMVERILAGEGTAKGEAACDVLRSGLLTEQFGKEAAAATFRPGSKYVPHALCTATWSKPNQTELAAAQASYEQRKAMARATKKPFDEARPPSDRHEVSLTILDRKYRSAAEAVADLESSVAALEKGITVTVQGKEHTTQMDFDPLSSEVGDRSAWAPKIQELQVAKGYLRYAMHVSGFDDPATNRAQAVALAKKVAAAL